MAFLRLQGAALASVVLVAACGGASEALFEGDPGPGADTRSDASTNPGVDAGQSVEEDAGRNDARADRDEPRPSGCSSMDLVFVVDNSGSMAEEQNSLVASFPKILPALEALRTSTGQAIDYRIGVMTTDLSASKDGGRFRRTGGGCDAGPSRAWLQKGDANLSAAFACRAMVGTAGASQEQPLACLDQALTTRITDGSNADNGAPFVREDALLGVVIITDEDESNTTPVADFVAGLDRVKKGRDRWSAALVSGPAAGSCSSSQFGSAAAAPRLHELIAKIGVNGVASSICAGDLVASLEGALKTFERVCKAFPPR
jgi:hypothetical protein